MTSYTSTRRDLLIASMGAGAVSSSLTAPLKAANTKPASLGLQVRGAEIYYNGNPFRGIGCNFFNALNVKSRRHELEILAGYNVPFLRLNFGQYWPGRDENEGWRLFLTDKSRWFGALDDLVADAERARIGIIATMFWRLQTPPDLMKYIFGKRDSLGSWGDSRSNTRTWMREATSETVRRYENSPAIWGWEMANEPWTPVLLPLVGAGAGSQHQGGAASYSASTSQDEVNGRSDLISAAELLEAFHDWANVVTKSDKFNRLRSSGASAPSSLSYNPNNLSNRNLSIPNPKSPLDGPHTPIFENPAPDFNVVSAHVYPHAERNGYYFSFSPYMRGAPGLVRELSHIALSNGRPLFLGEFGSLSGASGQERGGPRFGAEAERELFNEILETIVSTQVAISALWDYGMASYGGERWGVCPGSGREYQLLGVAQANDRLKYAANRIS